MKKLVLAAITAGFGVTASTAQAVENWTPYTTGIAIGSAAGALPAPGVYFQNTTYYADIRSHDSNGNNNGVKINAIVDVPVLLWAPDVQVLGAKYAVYAVQPFDRVTTSVGDRTYTQAGLFETILSPLNLSWELPSDFHFATGLAVYLPDGTFNSKKAGAPPSSNFWSFEPSIGISWLHDGWNLSAKVLADFNLENDVTHYQSGHVANLDASASKRFGKWSFGLGGYARVQFSDDEQNGKRVGDGNRAEEYGVGPYAGYDFGPVTLEAFYTEAVAWKNESAGSRFFTRLGVPF
ncbi:MAG: hypothetical protein RLZZ501_2560 [Pseudomonadota bacterium]|jgi:hypothetical protein